VLLNGTRWISRRRNRFPRVDDCLARAGGHKEGGTAILTSDGSSLGLVSCRATLLLGIKMISLQDGGAAGCAVERDTVDMQEKEQISSRRRIILMPIVWPVLAGIKRVVQPF
jgi:hypothetical protein